MKFCNCGSLIINEVCSNKKCHRVWRDGQEFQSTKEDDNLIKYFIKKYSIPQNMNLRKNKQLFDILKRIEYDLYSKEDVVKEIEERNFDENFLKDNSHYEVLATIYQNKILVDTEVLITKENIWTNLPRAYRYWFMANRIDMAFELINTLLEKCRSLPISKNDLHLEFVSSVYTMKSSLIKREVQRNNHYLTYSETMFAHAIYNAKKAIEYSPESYQPYYVLYGIYKKSNNMKLADYYFNKAKEYDKNSYGYEEE